MVGDYIERIQNQYGQNALLYLNIIPYNSLPVINRIDLRDTVRPCESTTISFSYTDINGVLYTTSALFNHHPFYVFQAGKIIFFHYLLC